MTKKEKNKLNSDKQKIRIMRMGLRPHTFAITTQAKRAIRQVAVDLDLKDYQALDKIIQECNLSKKSYKRFK